MTDTATQGTDVSTDTIQVAATNVAAPNLLDGQNSQDNAGKQDAAKAAGEVKTEAVKPVEAYQPFTMPEGMKMDETAFKDFSTLAKEVNMTQEQAQKVSDIGAGIISRYVQSIDAQKAEEVQGWKDAVLTDKEIGGDKLKDTLAVANAFLDQFGSKELVDALVSTGLANHPAVVKAFYKAGKAVTPEKTLMGDTPAGKDLSAAQVLFPQFQH